MNVKDDNSKENRTSHKSTLEPYFDNRFLMYGKYDIPLIKKQVIDLSNLNLIRFSSCRKEETENLDATVHFFEYDYKFDEVWKSSEHYVRELKQYKQIMSPNFSVYTNMAFSLQIFNTFRSRWLGAYWQSKGLTVIPTIGWALKDSYDFAFDGIETGSIIATSTIGCAKSKKLFLEGFAEMARRLKPKKVILYAKPFPELYDMADLIVVPYSNNSRVSYAIKEDN